MIPYLLPELCLFACVICGVLFEPWLNRGFMGRRFREPFYIGMTLMAAGFCLVEFDPQSREVLGRSFELGPLGAVFKFAVLLACVFSMILGSIFPAMDRESKGDFYLLTVLSSLSGVLALSSANLFSAFLAAELFFFLSIALAVVAQTPSLRSEVMMKLFTNQLFGTFLILWVLAFFFLIAGSFELDRIREALSQTEIHPLLSWSAFGLLLVVFASRVGWFPFHLLRPEVLTGANTPVAAYLTLVPSLFGAALFTKLCLSVFSQYSSSSFSWTPLSGVDWRSSLAVVVSFGATIANLSALRSKKIYRKLGYAALVELSLVLFGLVVSSDRGVAGFIIHVLVVLLALSGIFSVLLERVTTLPDLNGLVWVRPVDGIAFCIFLMALAGLPPLPGFASKAFLLSSLIEQKRFGLSALMGLNFLISVAFYSEFLRTVFVRPNPDRVHPFLRADFPRAAGRFAMSLALPLVVLSFVWGSLVTWITKTIQNQPW